MTRSRMAILALSIIVLAAPIAQGKAPPTRVTVTPPIHAAIPPPLPDSPAQVASVKDAAMRRYLEQELGKLDTFLDKHPQERWLRARIWFVAWHRTSLTPVQLAAAMWCAEWAPRVSYCRT